MEIEGRIEKIIINGYERFIHLDVSSRQRKLWFHLIQHEEYLEPGGHSKFLDIGQNVTLEVGIDLVNDYSVVNNCRADTNKFLQPIDESSHVIAEATVVEIKDDYTLICNIEDLGRNILVEFEEKVDVEKGDTITVKGNLKAEVC